MSKIIRTKVYNFSELGSEAKEVAIESNRDINFYCCDWWECIYEDAEQAGVKITSFDLDRHRHAEGSFLLSANEVAQNILNNHGEECETYKTAALFMGSWEPIFNEYMDETSENYETIESEDKLKESEEDFLKSILEDYSIILQKEYDYLYSDDAVIKSIDANETYFTKDGKIFNK